MFTSFRTVFAAHSNWSPARSVVRASPYVPTLFYGSLVRGGSRISKGGVDGSRRGSTRHLGNYPQDPGNEVVIKPEHRLSTWVGKRERFPANFAIMSQSESYFASLGVVKWLPCELLREKWRQTAKRGVTTTRHERELIFLSLFIFYF